MATLPALQEEKGLVYQWAKQQLTVELRRSPPGTPKHKQALALVEALERMPNPIESVGVLVAVLEQPRLGRSLESRAREALQERAVVIDDQQPLSGWNLRHLHLSGLNIRLIGTLWSFSKMYGRCFCLGRAGLHGGARPDDAYGCARAGRVDIGK